MVEKQRHFEYCTSEDNEVLKMLMGSLLVVSVSFKKKNQHISTLFAPVLELFLSSPEFPNNLGGS